MIQKDAMPASRFVKSLAMPDTCRNVILHTRARTQGSEYNNNNNHPVVTGGIVGVHNGGVWNDNTLFKRMGIEHLRIAEVDTEAIFAAIAYGRELNEDGRPRLGGTLATILESIEGSAAIAWQEVEGDPMQLHLARISNMPLEVGTTAKGSLLFASTAWTIREAAKSCGLDIKHVRTLAEGTYLRVIAGKVVDVQDFHPARSGWDECGYMGMGMGYRTTKGRHGTHTVMSSSSSTSSSNGSKKDDAADGANKEDGKDGQDGKEPFAHCDPREFGVPTEVELATLARVLKDLPDTRLTPGYASPVTLSKIVGDTLDEPLAPMPRNTYMTEYRRREESAEAFVKLLRKQRVTDLWTLMKRIGMLLRPSMWCVTHVAGIGECKGQLWVLPQTFPLGSYLLRVMIPNGRYKTGYEPIVVERYWNEFLLLPKDEIPLVFRSDIGISNSEDNDTARDVVAIVTAQLDAQEETFEEAWATDAAADEQAMIETAMAATAGTDTDTDTEAA